MIRVIEAFSGIGSQVKALQNAGIEHEIVSTIEWDINAICAYDLIHNGPQNLDIYINKKKSELLMKLQKYTLSNGGKEPLTNKTLARLSEETLRRILCAIDRTNNLASITEVKGSNFPERVDLLTYSFPCQDLSLGGSWHGSITGIRRDVLNRSGMLWEVERILKELIELNRPLPSFLLMENVSNILSAKHREDFMQWTDFLKKQGYENKIYTLNAAKFGVPQKRIRTYMVSVLCKTDKQKEQVQTYFNENDLEVVQSINPQPLPDLVGYLRTNYDNEEYRSEAEMSSPNFTPSRVKIMEENDRLYDGENTQVIAVKTITTKQDRNPNSGVISFRSENSKKSPFRYLTPRECFLLMGFDESDYQVLVDNNFLVTKGRNFFTKEKLIKLAGNSIVVNVLENIFIQIDYIKSNYIDEEDHAII